MLRIRGVSRAIGLFVCALLFSVAVGAQGKTPTAKGNAGANPVQVQVAVYPGDAMRALPREAAGILPIVIFSSATFNAANVNTETLFLVANKLEFFGTNGKSACRTEDVNRDSRLDLVCTIQSNTSRAKFGTSLVAVEGQMQDGARFRGEFSLQLLPGPPARPAPAKR
jgi:hypothetical protein